ncbi:MAG: carboxylesterase family protein [Anaerolineae bacterium]|nr:carboxylesterase family protein [Anaerolineae bacterium]
MQFSLHHLLRQPETAAENPPLLILLHGVGSNEYDLFGLSTYLPPEFLVLSARAPNPLAPNSHAWFPIQFLPDRIEIDPEKAETSRQLVLKFISEAVEFYGVDPQQVYLMGFSQGAIISFSVMLSQPSALAGVVGMSGRILPEIKPLIVPHNQLKDFPVLVVHGTQDEVLPIHHGRASNELLSGLPLDLTYQEYAMGHEITGESLGDILAWLRGRLGAGQ